MWSKIQKKLYNNLPDCLKDKITIQMTAYRFGWRSMDKGHQCPTIVIKYKGKIILRTYEYRDFLEHYYKWPKDRKYDTDRFFRELREYYNLKHEISSKSDNIYFKMFSLLDKRTGKRTLKRYIEEGLSEKCLNEENFALFELFMIRLSEEKLLKKASSTQG